MEIRPHKKKTITTRLLQFVNCRQVYVRGCLDRCLHVVFRWRDAVKYLFYCVLLLSKRVLITNVNYTAKMKLMCMSEIRNTCSILFDSRGMLLQARYVICITLREFRTRPKMRGLRQGTCAPKPALLIVTEAYTHWFSYRLFDINKTVSLTEAKKTNQPAVKSTVHRAEAVAFLLRPATTGPCQSKRGTSPCRASRTRRCTSGRSGARGLLSAGQEAHRTSGISTRIVANSLWEASRANTASTLIWLLRSSRFFGGLNSRSVVLSLQEG